MSKCSCGVDQIAGIITEKERQEYLQSLMIPDGPQFSFEVLSVIQRRSKSLWTCRFSLRNQTTDPDEENNTEIYVNSVSAVITFKGPDFLAGADFLQSILSGEQFELTSPGLAATPFAALQLRGSFELLNETDSGRRFRVSNFASLADGLDAQTAIPEIPDPADFFAESDSQGNFATANVYKERRCVKYVTSSGATIERCEYRYCYVASNGTKTCDTTWKLDTIPTCAGCVSER
ncbi:MAG: hypothetical protein ACKO2L_06220 [Planctomycetaceae bacterium]